MYFFDRAAALFVAILFQLGAIFFFWYSLGPHRNG